MTIIHLQLPQGIGCICLREADKDFSNIQLGLGQRIGTISLHSSNRWFLNTYSLHLQMIAR